ncbi:MAG: trypsin-like peptidase domain-containing protein [Acidobacteriota bacterium]
MAVGIIIHIEVGTEKRTEYFSDLKIRIGSDDSNDLEITSSQVATHGLWFELENADGVYRVTDFSPDLELTINGKPIRRFIAISDGDTLSIAGTDVSFAFFSLETRSSMIAVKREQRHISRFIEEAALESAASVKRDDAKTFLREFTRELVREISLTSKLIFLVLSIGFIGGVLYLGFALSSELRQSRKQAEGQSDIIKKLEDRLGQTTDQIGQLDKTNKDLIKTVSLAPNLRVEYGGGVCLIVGVYDLVDRKTGKALRYAEAQADRPNPYESAPSEDSIPQPVNPQATLTTEGNGSPVEYDFIGTGFHVGGGYIVTNRHVMQPWEEDDLVKQMIKNSNGRARVKRLVIYFPNYPQPFPLKVKQIGTREDLAVATVDPATLPSEIPILPLEADSDAATVGKSVVTMGYPSGPDRLLAMVEDDEAKSINTRFGNSRQNLINFLAQSLKIVPLTTQGAITDLDAHRIVHDAKTAEGGSGAPLFGQSAKVIGVNFGVFTENTAANMAVPIRYAIDLLKKAGWKSPEELKQENADNQLAGTNTNTTLKAQ